MIAAMFAMSSNLHPRERSFIGFLKPCKTGPIVCAPPSLSTNLYAQFAASRLGKINTFASPFRLEPGNFLSQIDGTSAESTCISPSMARHGHSSFAIATASRTLSTNG